MDYVDQQRKTKSVPNLEILERLFSQLQDFLWHCIQGTKRGSFADQEASLVKPFENDPSRVRA